MCELIRRLMRHKKHRAAVRAVIFFYTAHRQPFTRYDMPQAINATPVTARIVLLDAEGKVTTKFPEGALPAWSTDQPGAFVLAPSPDGLSCEVSAPSDASVSGVLTFMLGTIVATAEIAHESAAPAPAPVPVEPGVAVSASISFEVAPAA